MARSSGCVRSTQRPSSGLWSSASAWDANARWHPFGARAYEKTTGQSIQESSFYDRFNRGFAAMLKSAVDRAMVDLVGVGRNLRGPLAGVRDVILTDSTVIRLHDFLARDFPGCRTNHTKSALKAHAILSVAGLGKASIKVTGERAHDGPVFKVGKWVKDHLLLFDLGYFRYQLFACIHRNGGYFLARLKANANPTIVAINRVHRDRAVPVVGEKLRDVADRLLREVPDVEVTVRFQRRTYAGRARHDVQTLRVVGIRDDAAGCHHSYVTNVPVAKLAAEDIRATYALRWQVEIDHPWCTSCDMTSISDRQPAALGRIAPTKAANINSECTRVERFRDGIDRKVRGSGYAPELRSPTHRPRRVVRSSRSRSISAALARITQTL